jgi:hypothetical protein
LLIAVTVAIGVQPAGKPAPVTLPPLLVAMQATSTSPAAVPEGRVRVREPVALALTTVLVDSRVIPLDDGGVTSTVHVRLAGVGSVLADGSVARTWKVCEPSVSPPYVFGLAHAAKAPASRLHSNVEPPSLDAKSKVAPVLVVIPLGPAVIVVSGGIVSGAGGSTAAW